MGANPISTSTSTVSVSTSRSREAPGARYCLLILTFINLLNYIDRYVPSAITSSFQPDLGMDDTEVGATLTVFTVVYMIASPIFGHLDALGYSRKRLICGGIIFWSCTTAAAALSWNIWSFFMFRSLVGVGEAAYATIAPALLSDFYPPSRRNVILSYFYLAIPVGSALGYVIGGVLDSLFGWRAAFLACGFPGIIVAILTLWIQEPPRGALDEIEEGEIFEAEALTDETILAAEAGLLAALDPTDPNANPNSPAPVTLDGKDLTAPLISESSDSADPVAAKRSPSPSSKSPAVSEEPPRNWPDSLRYLAANQVFVVSTAGLVAVTFAAGAIAAWFPQYLQQYFPVSERDADIAIGAITVVSGIGGTLFGAFIGEKAKGRVKNPYLFVSGASLAVTAVLSWVMLIIPNIYIVCALLAVAQIFLWSYTGPLNSLTANCVPAEMRIKAFAVQILLQHSLGDAISPLIVGGISTGLGSLRTAILLVPAAVSLGTLFWLAGWKYVPNENHVLPLPPRTDGLGSSAPKLDASNGASDSSQVNSDDYVSEDPYQRMNDDPNPPKSLNSMSPSPADAKSQLAHSQ